MRPREPNGYHRIVRVAIVTPYSWAYPGGVNGHVDALACELMARGHELRVLAPWDPPDRIRPAASPWPGRSPRAARLPGPARRDQGVRRQRIGLQHRRLPRRGDADAPRAARVRARCRSRARAARGPDAAGTPAPTRMPRWSRPSTPTRPSRCSTTWRRWPACAASSTSSPARIAVSEAAAWTGRRWFGGSYAVIPNGVDVDAAPRGPKPPPHEMRLIFVGRPEERKGLPVLLTRVRGADRARGRPAGRRRRRGGGGAPLSSPTPRRERIEALGRVSDEELWRRLGEADLLCAPSLAAESFGMVLTEAFAAGTPVMASNIAGYADVVSDGVDGVLVPPADPQRLAEQLQELSRAPERRPRDGGRGAAVGAALRLAAGRGRGRACLRACARGRGAAQPPATGSRAALGLTPADGRPPRARQAAAVARPRAAHGQRPPPHRPPDRSRRRRDRRGSG